MASIAHRDFAGARHFSPKGWLIAPKSRRQFPSYSASRGCVALLPGIGNAHPDGQVQVLWTHGGRLTCPRSAIENLKAGERTYVALRIDNGVPMVGLRAKAAPHRRESAVIEDAYLDDITDEQIEEQVEWTAEALRRRPPAEPEWPARSV